MNQAYSDSDMVTSYQGFSSNASSLWFVCHLTQEVEFCRERKSVAIRDKSVIPSVRRLHVINCQLVDPGDMLPDVTKETTLVVTHNYAKDSCPSNILHEAISQSEKHTKWLSPCVTAVALAYLLP